MYQKVTTNITVVLDTNLSPELIEEGFCKRNNQ
mgnify:CR=1 FL=1